MLASSPLDLETVGLVNLGCGPWRALGNLWRGASIWRRLQDDAALYDEQVLPISPILKEASVKLSAVDV
jgi:hypothetical protein